jgi:16S rRNA (uracil1498-N3)-methyltransferase
VLRLRSGDVVCVADGHGRWRSATFGPELTGLGETQQVEVQAPQVCIGAVVPKGERPEMLVQKLTELGVDRITLLRSERSVVRWSGDAVQRNLDRLRRVAREAAMQSRRPRLPVIDGVVSIAEFAVMAADEGATVALAEPGGGRISLEHPWVAVGPEGGWSPAEVADATAVVGLGTAILRVETAAMAVGTALCGLREGWIQSHLA